MPPRRTELMVERARRGLTTQKAAAAEIGITYAQLSRAERGEGISLLAALKIAAYYGRPIQELFGDLWEQAA